MCFKLYKSYYKNILKIIKQREREGREGKVQVKFHFGKKRKINYIFKSLNNP